jgi:hypothetical protein
MPPVSVLNVAHLLVRGRQLAPSLDLGRIRRARCQRRERVADLRADAALPIGPSPATYASIVAHALGVDPARVRARHSLPCAHSTRPRSSAASPLSGA